MYSVYVTCCGRVMCRMVILPVLMIISMLLPAMDSGAVEYSVVYTTSTEFDLGEYFGVNATAVADQVQLDTARTTYPYLWVPGDGENTISKVDTRTGYEVARYYAGSHPGRIAVDMYGNAWTGQREFNSSGLVKKIVMSEEDYIDKNGNGVCDTSRDLNGDHVISAGEMVADDELVVLDQSFGYSEGIVRMITVDAQNRIWLGGWQSGYLVCWDQEGNEVTSYYLNAGPFYGEVDKDGFLWIDLRTSLRLAKYDTTSLSYVTDYAIPTCTVPESLAISGSQDFIWFGNYNCNDILRFTIASQTWDRFTGTGVTYTRSLCVDHNDDVWVPHSQDHSLSKFSSDGTLQGIIDTTAYGYFVASTSVDADGYIWATVSDGSSSSVLKIDPGAPGGAPGSILGAYPVARNPYPYGDPTGWDYHSVTTHVGTWTVEFDTEYDLAPWGTVSWTGSEPTGTRIMVDVKSVNDNTNYSGPWTRVTNGVSFSGTVEDGRYLKVRVTLQSDQNGNLPLLYDLQINSLISTPTPTSTQTSTPTEIPTDTPTFTPPPTSTDTATPDPSSTPTPTNTPTVPPTPSPTQSPPPPTQTETATWTPAPTNTVTPVLPTVTETPEPPTGTPTHTPVPPPVPVSGTGGIIFLLAALGGYLILGRRGSAAG